MIAGELTKPLLRWAGSKRANVGTLVKLAPTGFDRYIEPFAGSATVFFHLAPKAAVLGDLNSDLIDTYRTIKSTPRKVHAALCGLQTGADAYYEIRDSWQPKTAIERAARFVYLNRFCFNGLYRTNRAGRFNVPFGRPKNFNIPTLSQFTSCAALLKRAELRAGDFRAVLAEVHRDDFVYLDPPYATSTRRTFVEYQREAFSQDDVADLVSLLRQVDIKGATFLLSYAYTAEARMNFKGWHQKRLTVHRNVAGFHGARRKQHELLVSNKPFRVR